MESLWEGLARRPADPVMFARLREQLESGGDFSGLTRLYNQRAEAVGGEEALYLYLTIAEVWASRQGDQEGVSQAYEKALELSGDLSGDGPAQVRDALKEVFWARGDWRSLADLTEAEARQMPPGADRARHWMELAQLRMAKLNEITLAIRAYVKASEEPGAPTGEIRRILREMLDRDPEHDGIFRALRQVSENHLRTPEDAQQLIELLERRYNALDETHDRDRRLDLLVHMGRLSATHLPDPTSGIHHLRKAHEGGAPTDEIAPVLDALLERGENLEALALLRALALGSGQWHRFVDAGRREAALIVVPAERAAVLIEVAAVYEQQLSDLTEASRLYREAADLDPEQAEAAARRLQDILTKNPEQPEALEALKDIHRRLGDDEALLQLLEAEEARETREPRRAAILIDMAKICAGSYGRPDRALEYFEAASDLAASTDQAGIIEGLFGLYHQGYYIDRVEVVLRGICTRFGHWEALAALLELLVEDASEQTRQAAIHFELGGLLEVHLGELERAMHHFQRAFRLDTDHPEYIEAGRELYRKMGNLEMVARLYDIELKVSTGPEQAARLLVAKSKVLAEEVRDPARALEALGRAYAVAPDLAEAQEALEALVLGSSGTAATTALESAYLGAGRPAEAAAIYLMIGDRLRARLEEGGALDRKAALHMANDADLRAYELDPTGNARARAVERLEQGLSEEERWTELVELIEHRASAEPDSELRGEMLLRLGSVAWDKLGAMELASAAWQAALELSPGHLRAFTRLETMFIASGALDELDELICWALDKAPWASANEDTPRRSALFVRLARLREENNNPRDAYRAWLLLGELDPNHAEVKTYFEARADTPEGAQDLFRLLERGLIELTDIGERAERLGRLATLASDQMRDPLLAIDQYRAIMELEDVDAEVREHAVGRLRDIYRDIEQLDELVALLEGELERGQTPADQREAMLRELVDIHADERHDMDAARGALERLIEVDGSDVEARLRLALICHRNSDFEAEAEVLRALIKMGGEGTWDRINDHDGGVLRPADLTLRLARLEAGEVDDQEAAVATYKSLLETEQHREVALDELQRVLVQMRDFEGLMGLLEGQAEQARDTSDKIHFIGRMAMLAEQELGDMDRAIALWQRTLEVRAKDLDALQTLEQLFGQTERWDDLIDVCRTRLTVTTDPEGRARLHRKIGRIHRQTDHLDEARDTYLALIEEFPEDVLARQALYEIYSVQESHESLMGIIDELLRFESDAGRRHELMREQCRVALEALEDPDRAVEVLDKLVDEHPQDVESLQQLFDLHVAHMRWARAAVTLARLAEQAPDTAHKIELLLDLARIHREELQAPEQAAEVLEQVIALHPANRTALERLETIYAEIGQAEALVRIRGRLFELTHDPIAQIGLLQSLSKVLETDLSQPAEAFERTAQAHEIDPSDHDHLDELYRLAEAAELWPRLLEVLSDDAARASSLDSRHRTQVRMAELVENHLDDRQRAFAIYRDIFVDAPRQGDVLGELERLAGLDEALWPEVAALYRRLIELTTEPEARVKLRWRLSEIELEGLADPRAAFNTHREALSIEALQDETLTRLRTLAEDAGLWNELVSLGESRWREVEGASEQIEVLLDNARLIEEHLEDQERALEQYVLAFQIDPRHEVAESRLQTLAASDDSIKDLLLKLYEVAIKDHHVDDDTGGQIHFLGRMASLHETREEPEEAFVARMRAFKVDPHKEEVRAELERIGATVERLGEVAHAYQVEASANRRDQALPFYLGAARLMSESLGFPEQAIELLRGAMDQGLDNDEVLEALETLYKSRNDMESLVGLIIHRAERTVDRARRYDAYLQVAELLESTADPERAVEYYRRALRLNPRNVEVLDRLAALYARLTQVDRQARCLEQIVEIVDGDPEEEEKLVSVLDTLARLYLQNRRPSRSVEVERRLMTLRPLRQDFFERLETHLSDTGKLDALMEEYERRVTQLDALIEEVDALEGDAPARLLGVDGEPPSHSALRLEQLRLLRVMVDMAIDSFRNPRRAVKLLGELLGRFPDDAEALERLADLYAKLERWQDHIDTLRRGMALAAGPESRARVLRVIAEVYEEKLYHPDKAATVLSELVEVSPDDGSALVDLGRLRLRGEHWEEALEAYRAAVSLEEDAALPTDLQADIWCQMAEIEEKFRRDDDAAFSNYEAALKIHPDNPQARQAVIRYLAGGNQWERQISLLRIEVDQTASREAKARLLWEIGTIFRDRAQDPLSALDCFENALVEDGDLLMALRDMADAAWQGAQWSQASEAYTVLLDGSFTRMALESEPMAEQQFMAQESPEDPAFVTYMVRLGQALAHQGRADEAFERFTQALRVRSTNAAALMGAGRYAFEKGDRDVAARHLGKLMSSHGDKLSAEKASDATFMLGCLQRDGGQAEKALEYFAATLEKRPEHRRAAQHALDIATELHREEEAAGFLRALVTLTEDDDARRKMLMRLGDMLVDRLERPEEGLEAYSEVLVSHPEDTRAAERCLGIHVSLEHWDKALEVSEQLVARDEAMLESMPALTEDRRFTRDFVRRLVRHGNVLFQGQDKGDEAIAVYERALEIEPTDIDPLVQIGLVLGQRGDFEALGDRYDRFVEALPETGVSARVEVLRRLGALLHEELKVYDRALAVYMELAQLAPQDVRVHDALAELFLTAELTNPEAALESLRTLVRLGEVSEDRVRQILDLYRRTGRDDGAGQLLRLLDFCRCTSKEEQQQIRDFRDDLGDLKPGDLSGDAYTLHVLPPLARGPLSSLMTFVSDKGRGAMLQSLNTLDTTEDDRISDRRNLNVANIFRDVAGIVGMTSVELYLKRPELKGVRVLMTHPSSIVIGEDVFRGLFNREQRFVLGRALEMSRPAFIAATALEPFEFMAFYEALFELGGAEVTAAADARLLEGVERWRDALGQALEPEELETLQGFVAKIGEVFSERRPTAMDWQRTAWASAQRVGLFLSGDPLVALKRLLREESRLRSPSIRSFDDLIVAMETSRDVREVVLYLLSEDFILARRSLKGEEAPEIPTAVEPISLDAPPAVDAEAFIEVDSESVEIVEVADVVEVEEVEDAEDAEEVEADAIEAEDLQPEEAIALEAPEHGAESVAEEIGSLDIEDSEDSEPAPPPAPPGPGAEQVEDEPKDEHEDEDEGYTEIEDFEIEAADDRPPLIEGVPSQDLDASLVGTALSEIDVESLADELDSDDIESAISVDRLAMEIIEAATIDPGPGGPPSDAAHEASFDGEGFAQPPEAGIEGDGEGEVTPEEEAASDATGESDGDSGGDDRG